MVYYYKHRLAEVSLSKIATRMNWLYFVMIKNMKLRFWLHSAFFCYCSMVDRRYLLTVGKPTWWVHGLQNVMRVCIANCPADFSVIQAFTIARTVYSTWRQLKILDEVLMSNNDSESEQLHESSRPPRTTDMEENLEAQIALYLEVFDKLDLANNLCIFKERSATNQPLLPSL